MEVVLVNFNAVVFDNDFLLVSKDTHESNQSGHLFEYLICIWNIRLMLVVRIKCKFLQVWDRLCQFGPGSPLKVARLS